MEKRIHEKFQRDLAKQEVGKGLITLFCNVDVSPALKFSLSKEAIAKGYRLEVFDIERLRSLLDSSLKEIRRRYLGIDDEITVQLRSETKKLLRFPQAVADAAKPVTILETLFGNQLPRRLFDLLMKYDEVVIREVPSIGGDLHKYMIAYYDFRAKLYELENDLYIAIGKLSRSAIPAAWRIHLKYVLMRFAGAPQEQIISGGNFLNYGITWDDAERIFSELAKDPALASAMSELLELYDGLTKDLVLLTGIIATDAA